MPEKQGKFIDSIRAFAIKHERLPEKQFDFLKTIYRENR